MQILTCQHCRTTVAVSSDFICPSCSRHTTNVPLPLAQETLEPIVSSSGYRPDTAMNRVFMIASFIMAGVQIVSLIRHSVTHHQPVMGLDHVARPVEFFATVAIALLLQVVGSAFGLGAGSFRIACIVSNIVCCVICMLLSPIV